MAAGRDSTDHSRSVRPYARALVMMVGHEMRGLGRRLLGRDTGATLLGTPPLSDEGRRLREDAARAVVLAESWSEALETVRSRWDARARRRAWAMLGREDFDEFVVFSVRTVNEVLRQGLEGPILDRSDLKDGLECEARLARMGRPEIVAEAVRLAPRLTNFATGRIEDERTAVRARVESELRTYARGHGPIPAILLDATVQQLCTRGSSRD